MILPEADYKKVMESMPVVCIDCLVQNDQGEFLLVKRNNEPLKNEFWLPGGRLFKHERLHDAVQRKMREELGIDVRVVRNLGFFEEFFDKTAQNAAGGFHAISFLYLVKPLGSEIQLDRQSSDWGWFRELPERLREYPSLSLGDFL
ncbi:NUDIX domain-containing protein [Desulfuromonas sp. TF]|uniref:NUDIX domain-containing protein n=1 Tax=Desulfuromonas sp. TF TaxID=1232410 RepID=UPI00041E2569|nr:NUDIX domain-containing protein [Desulfuromonas sp. TF]